MSSEKFSRNKLLQISAIIIIIASLGYDGWLYWQLRNQNIALQGNVTELEKTIGIYQINLSRLRGEKATITDALNTEQAKNTLFQDQIQNIAGTVGNLEKLSKTDPELLKKYSKVYFLNENYIPPKLTLIDPKYLNIEDKPLQFHADVWPHLQKLLDDALSSGVAIQIISAYRSFGTQSSLKSAYTFIYGSGTANSFSADQGYSEHQLGTTLDFTTPTIGATFVGFDKSNAYKWLVENAYKYGFVISYPKENAYYTFEPWHWRYVGVSLATRLHNENNYFYNLDQRDIDQYLINFFD